MSGNPNGGGLPGGGAWTPEEEAARSAPHCECLGGSTHNDGARRRCDLCGLPVPDDEDTPLTSTNLGGDDVADH